jgi:voltage-dependent potassium channel beta subunit
MAGAGAPLYLLAGSGAGRSSDPVFQAALGRSGVPRARVAWVGAASGDDPALRRRDTRRLLKAGAGTVAPASLCGRRASAAEAARAIESADVVYISGGDVEAGMGILGERGMIPRLRAAHRGGTPFIGESAGSIMLCRCWIRWADPGDEGSAGLFPCIGLVPILCDTHGEEDGWGELRSALALRPVGARGTASRPAPLLSWSRTGLSAHSAERSMCSGRKRPVSCRSRPCAPDRSEEEHMEYRRLGSAGLKVSVLSLGSWVTYGRQVDVDAAAACMKAAWDEGVNFFDNAEAYEAGKSEEVMGAALKKLAWRRASYIVSTKIFFGMHDGVNERTTLNRKKLREGIDGALKRFGLEYIDLVFCHRPDPETPVEETVWSMHMMVESGKALYWGTSEWNADQIMEAWGLAEKHHLHKPQMEQPQYNLFVRRKVERQYSRLYSGIGLGLTIWSPLAAGVLTGKYNAGVPKDSRLALPGYEGLRADPLQKGGGAKDYMPSLVEAVKKLQPIAEELKATTAQLALAWCAHNPNVSTVITGASRPEQVKENMKAIDLLPKLTPPVIERIEAAVKGVTDL